MLAPPIKLRHQGRRRTVDHELVRALGAGAELTADEIAAVAGCTAMYVRQILRGVVGQSQQHSRFSSRPLFGRGTRGLPAIDHPALMSKQSFFHDSVIKPNGHQVFKSGHNSAKIGKRIVKGKWKGFEVYTLTLEERATCPTSCAHWRSCYGNNMHLTERFAHGDALETKIVYEVAALARRHPNGFAVRLHALGDFYSVRYVNLWRILLEECAALHVFGFSARWDYHRDPIAKALVDLVRERWDRFAIRFSNAPIDECATVSIEHPFQKPADAVICPQQIGKTTACSTCALCWQSRRRIAFIQH